MKSYLTTSLFILLVACGNQGERNTTNAIQQENKYIASWSISYEGSKNTVYKLGNDIIIKNRKGLCSKSLVPRAGTWITEISKFKKCSVQILNVTKEYIIPEVSDGDIQLLLNDTEIEPLQWKDLDPKHMPLYLGSLTLEFRFDEDFVVFFNLSTMEVSRITTSQSYKQTAGEQIEIINKPELSDLKLVAVDNYDYSLLETRDKIIAFYKSFLFEYIQNNPKLEVSMETRKQLMNKAIEENTNEKL